MKPETRTILRWTAWARALAGRHGRRHERVDHLSLQLARPRALAREVLQRSFFSSRRVQPRISLTIQPVLRASFWRGSEKVEKTASTERTLRTFKGERSRETERLLEVERFREVNRILPGRPALQTVFERLREPGRVLGNRLGREERAAETPALARSLAARVRREEKPLPGGSAARVLRPAEPAGREERRSLDPRRPEIPGWGSPAAVPGGFAVPAAPPINVEALTDQVMRQIDRRVDAWRERTGEF